MTMRDDDMEAINKFFMETAKVKTPAAEKIKKEWMAWWKEHKTWWGYSDEEFDTARNMRNKFNLANASTFTEQNRVAATIATGTTSEEAQGETRRAGTEGMFTEEEEQWIPTSWKVGAVVGVGLIAVGVFAKKLLALTPAAKFIKHLP